MYLNWEIESIIKLNASYSQYKKDTLCALYKSLYFITSIINFMGMI
jgi:hypothetical protein